MSTNPLMIEATTSADDAPDVTRVGNDIYFYCDVYSESCLQLTKLLKEVDSFPQWDAQKGSLRPITLHIQSTGGSLMSALGVADLIANLDTQTISIIEGFAASAATILSMACDVRHMTQNSYMLVHQFSSNFDGTYDEWKDDDKLNELLIQAMYKFYADHSKLSKKKVRKLLSHNHWVDAKEALESGFVDKII